MNPGFFTPLLLAIVCLLALPAQAQTARAATVIQRSAPAPSPATPESRLIEVYRLTGAGQTREARQRARRAAAALRENLKRRKAQARARQDGAGASHESAGIAPDKPKV